MANRMTERLQCRLCRGDLGLPIAPNVDMTCKNCGTKNHLSYRQSGLVVEDVLGDRELELRERLEEFARLRNYGFNEFKEPVILALLEKREKHGDFYCPCKVKTVLENVCPCKETRDGDVELDGMCGCRLFWKKESK